MEKIDLKGRNFLKLLDFTQEEILYLIDLAADLKKNKKDLRWQPMILEWGPHIWIRQAPRSEKRKALQIQQESLAECMMVSSTVATDRIL